MPSSNERGDHCQIAGTEQNRLKILWARSGKGTLAGTQLHLHHQLVNASWHISVGSSWHAFQIASLEERMGSPCPISCSQLTVPTRVVLNLLRIWSLRDQSCLDMASTQEVIEEQAYGCATHTRRRMIPWDSHHMNERKGRSQSGCP